MQAFVLVLHAESHRLSALFSRHKFLVEYFAASGTYDDPPSMNIARSNLVKNGARKLIGKIKHNSPVTHRHNHAEKERNKIETKTMHAARSRPVFCAGRRLPSTTSSAISSGGLETVWPDTGKGN